MAVVMGAPSLALPIPLPKCGEGCCRARVDGLGDTARLGKGSLGGLAAPGNAFPWKLGLPVPGIRLVAAPDLAPSPSSPFHLPWASRPSRSDVPVPDDPYLDTARSRRQAGNTSSWQASTHRDVSWAAPAALHGTAPVQSPACRALPTVIALYPGMRPQRSQTQSFMSPSLPGPIPPRFLRDFLNAFFPISLLGRGLDNV